MRWWIALLISAVVHGMVFEVMVLTQGTYVPPELLASRGDNASPNAPTITMRRDGPTTTPTLHTSPSEPVDTPPDPILPPLPEIPPAPPIEPPVQPEEPDPEPKPEPVPDNPIDAPPVFTDQQPSPDAPANPSDQESITDASPPETIPDETPVEEVQTDPRPELAIAEDTDDAPTVQLPGGSGTSGITRGVQLTSKLAPNYPPSCIRRGQEGLVVVAVEVLATGEVGTCTIIRSSGVAPLDTEAIRAIGEATFRPALLNDRPVTRTVNVPIRFELD